MENREQEIQKLIKFIKSMQSIIKTSPNPSQVERVKKDLAKYLAKLKEFVPDFDPSKESVDELSKRLLISVSPESSTSSLKEQTSPTSWDNKLPLLKASPHCTDHEINFLYSAIQFIQKEFWPVLSDLHLQLDFTHSQERQSLRLEFDEVLRELKSLLETIEDYSTSESPDFRDQLYKMKNKQIRLFIININNFLKKLKDFLSRLINELNKMTGVIKNPQYTIRFNPQFEEATLLNGYTILGALLEFLDFIQFVLKKINLPDLKQKKL
ncbi:MAG: hypothetical protein ACK4UJ_02065 [Leptonema sp. (in: bacteria)]